MSELIREEIRTARKNHPCCAIENWHAAGFCEADIDAEDIPIVRIALEEGEILAGQRYVYQSCKDGGEIFSVKARLDMHKICLKYELYPED